VRTVCGQEIVDALLLLHVVPLGDIRFIDTMMCCIIQHDERELVQVCNELVSEPRNDVIVSVKNFVVVSKMISLLLGAEGLHTPRKETSLVIWLFWRFHMRESGP
jgi:hypothetical protein